MAEKKTSPPVPLTSMLGLVVGLAELCVAVGQDLEQYLDREYAGWDEDLPRPGFLVAESEMEALESANECQLVATDSTNENDDTDSTDGTEDVDGGDEDGLIAFPDLPDHSDLEDPKDGADEDTEDEVFGEALDIPLPATTPRDIVVHRRRR